MPDFIGFHRPRCFPAIAPVLYSVATRWRHDVLSGRGLSGRRWHGGDDENSPRHLCAGLSRATRSSSLTTTHCPALACASHRTAREAGSLSTVPTAVVGASASAASRSGQSPNSRLIRRAAERVTSWPRCASARTRRTIAQHGASRPSCPISSMSSCAGRCGQSASRGLPNCTSCISVCTSRRCWVPSVPARSPPRTSQGCTARSGRRLRLRQTAS